MITPEEIKELFDYKDGKLIRLHGRYAGVVKGTKQSHGRLSLKINNKQYYYHRVVWAWHYGEWPSEVDHINRNASDNRIENLRDVTHRENNLNRGLMADNKSEFAGVSFSKTRDRAKKWRSYLGRKFLGWFETKAEAIAARVSAEESCPDHLRSAS